MIEKYIHSFNTVALNPADESGDLKLISSSIPKRSARRMSRLGIMVHKLLENIELDLNTSIIYGTRFSESAALENFLDSFPFASPIAFQTSIHPGGIEQALILNRRDIGPFFPMAGGPELMMNMLLMAFSSKTPQIILCGGEEKGSWLADFGLAHNTSFAFCMSINDNPEGAAAILRWKQDAQDKEAITEMSNAVQQLTKAQPVVFASQSMGTIEIIHQ